MLFSFWLQARIHACVVLLIKISLLILLLEYELIAVSRTFTRYSIFRHVVYQRIGCLHLTYIRRSLPLALSTGQHIPFSDSEVASQTAFPLINSVADSNCRLSQCYFTGFSGDDSFQTFRRHNTRMRHTWSPTTAHWSLKAHSNSGLNKGMLAMSISGTCAEMNPISGSAKSEFSKLLREFNTNKCKSYAIFTVLFLH